MGHPPRTCASDRWKTDVKEQRLRAGAFGLQPEGLIEGWREGRPARLYVNARAGEALAHGSFRRTGAAGLRVPPWPEAPLPGP